MPDEQRSTVNELVVRAKMRGALSPISARALQRPRIAAQIEEALKDGFTIDRPGEVILVTLMPDDSGSMITNGKNVSLINGHNKLIEAMFESPSSERMLLSTRFLNGTVLNPYRPLDYCEDLTDENYPCDGTTPLYEQTLILLGAVMAKAQELIDKGARVRTATLIMTDAASTEDHAEKLLPEVASVIRDMTRVADHLVAGMGFAAPGMSGVFEEVFSGMGFAPDHIHTATDPQAVLKCFRLFGDTALALTDGL